MMRYRNLRGLAIFIALLALAAPAGAFAVSETNPPANGVSAQSPAKNELPLRFDAGVKVGTIKQTLVTEASGLAASRKNANVLWVHNDSGDTARVFAMTTSGVSLGIYNLKDATAYDWEDMAIGPGPVAGKDYLYLGDIGDNFAARSGIVVFRVEEPFVCAKQCPVTGDLAGWEKLTLRYEDGARDAEALIVDPQCGDLYIITKRDERSRVYRAEASSLKPGAEITLKFMTQLHWNMADAADISPKGDEVIVRNYSKASVWKRAAGTKLWQAFAGTEYAVPLAAEPQGEAIAFDASGRGYYTTSEGVSQPIYRFARTEASSGAGTPTAK